MTSTPDLLPALQAQDKSLTALAEAAHKRDEAAFAGATAQLLFTLISTLPLVGQLANVAAREAFARSSYGKVQLALARAGAEDDAEAARQATARAVAEVLAPTLEAARESQAAMLATLEHLEQRIGAELEVFQRSHLKLRMKEQRGGVGAEVGHGAGVDLEARIETLSGGTGLVIKGRK